MPNSPRWCSASGVCRLEWRPSRWLMGALVLLAVLAALAALLSELPRAVAGPLAGWALLQGGWWVHRESRRPRAWFVFAGADLPVRLLRPGATAATPAWDSRPLEAARLQWRGPMAVLHWREPDGRRQTRCWWPDTLPAPARRALRLAGAPAAR